MHDTPPFLWLLGNCVHLRHSMVGSRRYLVMGRLVVRLRTLVMRV